MPRYCYSIMDKEGHREVVVERVFPMGDAPAHVRLDDGRRADRDLPAEFGAQAISGDYARPIESLALGWHPSQREEVMTAARREGVPLELELNRDKTRLAPILRNPRQRRRVLKWLRLVDRQSFY